MAAQPADFLGQVQPTSQQQPAIVGAVPALVAGSQFATPDTFYQSQQQQHHQKSQPQPKQPVTQYLQQQQARANSQAKVAHQPNAFAHQEQTFEGLYTCQPVYAPKPTYFSPQAALFAQQQAGRPLQPQSQPSQQQQLFYQQHQQQQSPVGAVQQAPAGSGLSVRQLPAEPRQLQQLVMSYSHQLAQLPPATHLSNGRAVHEWSPRHVADEQRLARAPQLFVERQPTRAHHQSDRDSQSTLSRFNQLDDRRSFTVRSQPAAMQHSGQTGSRYGLLELTSAALKRMFGLSSAHELKSPATSRHQPTTMLASQAPKEGAQVTVIDAGDDYYFRREVFKCQLVLQRLFGLICALVVLLSPVAMLLLPKMEFLLRPSLIESQSVGEHEHQPAGSVTHAVGLAPSLRLQPHFSEPPAQPQWRIGECGSDCDGPLVGFAVRFTLLLIAYWALYFRPAMASLPRVDFQRCLLGALALLLVLAYWLFFLFRLFQRRYEDSELQYASVVNFALSMLDSLVLLHYVAVVLLELRTRRKQFCIKVLRSPDGVSRYYSCGPLSIQCCAQFVLDKYQREFPQCGPMAALQLELERESAKLAGAGSHHHLLKSPRAERARSRPSSRSSRRHRDHSPAESTTRGHLSRPRSQADSSLVAQEPSSAQAGQDSANSADQSSDATSRPKESSLETVRAAGDAPSTNLTRSRNQNRDETESVRSGRSRRSTSRSHHRHRESREHRHAREPSSGGSSLAAADPLDELGKRVRRRNLKLLASVQEQFDRIKQVHEGKSADSIKPTQLAAINQARVSR